MMRLIKFIFQLALIVVIALWLADRPGDAHIVWHDTVIDTSAAFLALCVLVLGYALHLLFRLWHFLRHGPTHWKLRRALNKHKKGQDHVTQGLIAIASGNATEAGRLAIAARKHVGDTVTSQWLQAQAAQLAGDARSAREIFRKLAAHPEAAILGYRGLITEAKRAGQWDEVDTLLNELHRLKPATPWLSLIRMESAARKQQWADAESALSHAVTARLMDSDQGRRNRAALRIAMSRQEKMNGNLDLALQAAEQAARQAPDWLPASINLAECLAANENRRAAIRVIERVWKTHPHPQLARVIYILFPDALDAFRQMEKICRTNPDAVASHAALAEAALNADVWGEARRNLLSSVNGGTATQGIYKMLARLEKRERGDERAASGWLSKAIEAHPDPTWLCQQCNGGQSEWQPTCAHCGTFNSLDWQSAGKSRGLLATPQIGYGHD